MNSNNHLILKEKNGINKRTAKQSLFGSMLTNIPAGKRKDTLIQGGSRGTPIIELLLLKIKEN